MPYITSRVNGLKIAIPNDARNIIHRFAIAGGGNELVFEPVKRSDFNKSKQAEDKPLAFGSSDEAVGQDAPTNDTQTVTLSQNVVDDAPAKKPRKTRAKPAPAAPVAADDTPADEGGDDITI